MWGKFLSVLHQVLKNIAGKTVDQLQDTTEKVVQQVGKDETIDSSEEKRKNAFAKVKTQMGGTVSDHAVNLAIELAVAESKPEAAGEMLSPYEPYQVYYPLQAGDRDEQAGGDVPDNHVAGLQTALKRLGYMGNNYMRQVDGQFGRGGSTERAVKAIQYDLIEGRLRGKDWNQGRIKEVNGVVDEQLAVIIKEMLDASSEEFFKVPFHPDPGRANRKAAKLLTEQEERIIAQGVPPTYLRAILKQETGMSHYDLDGFVYVGCDETRPRYVYKSRGWGMGQYTVTHHPPTPEEAAGFINDVVNNLGRAIQELREKFDRFVLSSSSKMMADERMGLLPPNTGYIRGKGRGSSPLVECKYSRRDAQYMRDCLNCVRKAGRKDEFYNQAKYHKESHQNVPVWSDIPCDWPVAVRRYNGSGPDSYAYRAEILWHILGKDIRSRGVEGEPG